MKDPDHPDYVPSVFPGTARQTDFKLARYNRKRARRQTSTKIDQEVQERNKGSPSDLNITGEVAQDEFEANGDDNPLTEGSSVTDEVEAGRTFS